MDLANMLMTSRENRGISREELADKLSLPLNLIAFIEDPKTHENNIFSMFAKALDMTLDQFTGNVPFDVPDTTSDEKKEEFLVPAKYPNIRSFVLNPELCENHDVAKKIFASQEYSLIEKNLVLYLSTTALYNFCDTNISEFAFDKYLFALHRPLLRKFEASLDKHGITGENKEERLGNARSDVFACDTMENIAILVLPDFAEELEQKLSENTVDLDSECDFPLTWVIDEDMMKIEIKNQDGTIRDELKLLDVKERR